MYDPLLEVSEAPSLGLLGLSLSVLKCRCWQMFCPRTNEHLSMECLFLDIPRNDGEGAAGVRGLHIPALE